MKKKILFFFPNCEQGGTERVISLLSPMLNNDYELHLMTLCDKEKKYKFESFEFCVIHNAYVYKKGLVSKIKRYLFWYKALEKYVNENNIELVVAFGEIPNFLSLLLKKFNKRRLKVLINIRNSESYFLEKARFGWLIKWSMKLTYNIADRILTNSIGNKIDLINSLGLKSEVEVIYNPVSEFKEQLIDHRDFKRILHIGRLDMQKAQHYLLESFSRILQKHDNIEVELVLIGQGPLESEIKELSKELGVSDRVKFLGWQDNPFYWYQNSDVFVLTSLWEGMPNVVLESLANGCPVVSFNCPSGPSEIIDRPGVNGVLVDVEDVDSLTTSISKILISPTYALELSKAGKERIRVAFSTNNVYSLFRKNIERVL